MLTFEQLNYQVNNKTLVSGTTGQVLPHDFIVLTGQSGSGKSLLLKLLASLLPLTSGKLWLTGKTLQQLTPAVWRSHVAYLPQMGEMVEGTVLDNLKLPYIFQHHQQQTFSKDWQLQQLSQLGKSDAFLHQPSQTLSGGEKQLVNLLRTLQLNPALLLLDEPTASLDNTTTLYVEQLITDWYRHSSASIIWVSHEPTQIERLLTVANHHWQMKAGQLLCSC